MMERRVSPLKEYRTALALFLASSFVCAVLSLYWHEAFLAGIVANIFFWSWRAKRIGCSHCGCPLAPPIGASAVAIAKSFAATECRNCRAKLD